MRTEVETTDQFQKIISSVDKSILVFYQPNCSFCKWHMKRLDEQYGDIDYYAVDVTKWYDWYSENKYLKFSYPYTRIYRKGKSIFSIDGELYPTQINKLKKALDNV